MRAGLMMAHVAVQVVPYNTVFVRYPLAASSPFLSPPYPAVQFSPPIVSSLHALQRPIYILTSDSPRDNRDAILSPCNCLLETRYCHLFCPSGSGTQSGLL